MIQHRFKALAYVAPALLVLVAVCQRVLVFTYVLDPWKGGGFGMFSDISARLLRQMTITLQLEDGQEIRLPPRSITSRIPLGGQMRRIRSRILTMPGSSGASDLSTRLLAADWVKVYPGQDNIEKNEVTEAVTNDRNTQIAEGSVSVEAGEQGGNVLPYYRMDQDALGSKSQPACVSRVVVNVWQYRMDNQSSQLVLTQLREAAASK